MSKKIIISVTRLDNRVNHDLMLILKGVLSRFNRLEYLKKPYKHAIPPRIGKHRQEFHAMLDTQAYTHTPLENKSRSGGL